MFRFRWWLFCAALALGSKLGAAPPLTTIQDVLYSSDGTRFNGLLTISWPSFEASDTSNIAGQTLELQITNGILYIQLVPTANAITPAIYTVQYNSDNGTLYTEAWAVPASSNSLRVADVRVAPGTVTGSAPSPSSPGSTPPGTTPPAGSTIIQISDITGLQTALNSRPVAGTAFTVSRAAIIDASGAIDGAAGNLTDCLHVDGTSGSCGTVSTGGLVGFVDGETPGGTVNGTNANFTLANTPNPAASLEIFRNGLLLNQGNDYTLSGNSVTFLSASIPQTGDMLLASYRLGGSLPNVGFVDQETPSGVTDGVNNSFVTSQVPNPPTSLTVFRNGVRMTPGIDYTLANNGISFMAGVVPQPGDILMCSYRVAQ